MTARQTPGAQPSLSALRLDLDQPQDDVGIALAGAAHGGEFVDDGRLQPNEPLALRVELRLVADRAEGECGGDRVEGGGGDGDADHAFTGLEVGPR
jgi:hypothetical protein